MSTSKRGFAAVAKGLDMDMDCLESALPGAAGGSDDLHARAPRSKSRSSSSSHCAPLRIYCIELPSTRRQLVLTTSYVVVVKMLQSSAV